MFLLKKTKRAWLITGGLALFLICGAFLYRHCFRQSSRQAAAKAHMERFLAAFAGMEEDLEGCLILRHGSGFWSEYFRDASPADKRYSHIGIIIRDGDGYAVLHAEANDFTGEGSVRQDTVEDFLASAVCSGIYRLRSTDPKALAEAAEKFKGIPFDWNFDLDTDDEVYCTEFAAKAAEACPGGFKAPPSRYWGKDIIPADAFTGGDISRPLLEIF